MHRPSQGCSSQSALYGRGPGRGTQPTLNAGFWGIIPYFFWNMALKSVDCWYTSTAVECAVLQLMAISVFGGGLLFVQIPRMSGPGGVFGVQSRPQSHRCPATGAVSPASSVGGIDATAMGTDGHLAVPACNVCVGRDHSAIGPLQVWAANRSERRWLRHWWVVGVVASCRRSWARPSVAGHPSSLHHSASAATAPAVVHYLSFTHNSRRPLMSRLTAAAEISNQSQSRPAARRK